MADTMSSGIRQFGFTLIELLITLVVGMIILMGMTAVFIAETRTSSMLSEKTAAMGDLYLASQIMQSELRSAKTICWNGGKLVYQPFDSVAALGACGTPAGSNGSFEFRSADNTHPTSYICWNDPTKGWGCQELLRNLVAGTGLAVTTINTANRATMYTVTISAQYKGQDQNNKALDLTFKVWPRN